MKVSAEIGHVCSGESLIYEPFAGLNALRTMNVTGDIMYAVLLDDTHGQPEGLGPFMNRLRLLSLPDILVMQESAFAEPACSLLEAIPASALTVRPYRHSGTKAFCLESETGTPLLREDACGRRTPLPPLLSAAWSACRLGMLDWPPFGLVYGDYHEADRIINVLPWHIEGLEKVGQRILTLAGMQPNRMEMNFY